MLRKILIIVGSIIFAVLLYFASITPTPVISALTPASGAKYVAHNTPIIITFDGPLDSSRRRKLTLTTNPTISDQLDWDDNYTTLILRPPFPLTKNTTYSVVLTFGKQELTNFSFTTDPYDADDLARQAALQSEDDKLFGQQLETALAAKPWLKSLPIITPDYYIFYDSDAQRFNIHFTSPQSPELLDQALTSLEAIKVKPADRKYKTFQDAPTEE